MTFFWAFVAGLLTLINPCVLPLLPLVIASALQQSRYGPLALAFGLVISFTAVGVLVSAFGHLIGLTPERLNQIAAFLMLFFGAVLLIPAASGLFSRLVTPLAGSANSQIDSVKATGVSGQFAVGLLLGAVWSPCIGPTLGGAIGLAASGEGLLQAAVTMVFFGLGVSVVLLALAYGSREVVTGRRNTMMKALPWARPLMGVVLILVGLALLFRVNHMIDIWLLDRMPVWLQDLSVRY